MLKALDTIPRRSILGVDVAVLRRDEAIAYLLERLSAGTPTAVTFANANLLTLSRRDDALRSTLRDMLVLNDGVGVDLASWILYRTTFPDNLNGTDFTPALLAALPTGTRVFLYGARPHVVERAAKALAARYPIAVCGYHHGFADDERRVTEAVLRAQPQVVLVALGNPLQERWIAAHFERLSASLLIGVGAYFDFATATIPRAPASVRSLRLEWAFRLVREPRRLGRRYTFDAAYYLASVCTERLRERGKASAMPKQANAHSDWTAAGAVPAEAGTSTHSLAAGHASIAGRSMRGMKRPFSTAVLDQCAVAATRFIRKRAQRQDLRGIAVAIDDMIGHRVIATGSWERTEVDAIRAILAGATRVPRPSPEGLFVDVGANIGLYSILLSDYFAATLAIEPDPGTYRILQANILLKDLAKVTPVCCAASDVSGTTTLHTPSDGNLGWATLSPARPDRLHKLRECAMETCDALVSKYMPQQPVSLLKIDVEGHEPNVLRGASELLRRDGPVVLFESLDRDAETACRSILESAGYTSFLWFRRSSLLSAVVSGVGATLEDIGPEGAGRQSLICAHR